MSWIKGAFDKVKEKGAAVKDMAKEVAQKTKDARSRFMGATNSVELEVCSQGGISKKNCRPNCCNEYDL